MLPELADDSKSFLVGNRGRGEVCEQIAGGAWFYLNGGGGCCHCPRSRWRGCAVGRGVSVEGVGAKYSIRGLKFPAD